jgi:hypothetical protein
VSLTNSTLSGNTAALSGGGFTNNMAWLTLRHVTLAANTAITGGGLINMGGMLDAYNNILAHNVGGDCDNTTVPGTINTNTYNWVADGSCNENAVGLMTGDPRLGPLADNGGDTLTHALLPDSPAIDAGDPASCLPTDQRGAARDDWACDIGAYEVQLSDAASASKTVTGAGTYTFGPTLAKIEVTDTGDCLTGLQVERVAGNHPDATTPLQTGAYWVITPTGCTSGFTTTLRLPFAAADDTSRLCRWLEGSGPGYGWDCDDPTASHTTFVANSWVIRSGVNGFSAWVVGNDVGPTAVRLNALAARGFAPLLAGLLLLLGGAATVFRRRRR